MEYKAAIDYLYGLGHETLSMKLGLENITRLAEKMGRPDRNYKIVHVAGTNGKGSFCAMLASILAKASISSGLFTSPHLIKIEERFKFNLKSISKNDFCRLLERIKLTVDDMLENNEVDLRPTFFEHVTALGFDYFRECEAQIAVVEVGLGGRFDSTNIVTPILSVITPIDFDHQQYLGNTISEIAGEKAGILKRGVHALVAKQPPEAKDKIEQFARSVGSDLYWLEPDKIQCRKGEDGFWHLDLTSNHHRYKDVRVGLRGRHQVETAALAILAAEKLSESGFSINSEQIVRGIESVYWPGRLEVVDHKPLILLDGAHNPAGIATLRAFLDEWLEEKSDCYPRTLIFSTMRDKDIFEMARIIFPLFDSVILVERDDPRAIDLQEWKERFNEIADKVTPARGASAALSTARAVTPPQGLIVVSGSLHIIGEIKTALNLE
jgi:dihydrofolate synthase / folylpolyglutamate synthase